MNSRCRASRAAEPLTCRPAPGLDAPGSRLRDRPRSGRERRRSAAWRGSARRALSQSVNVFAPRRLKPQARQMRRAVLQVTGRLPKVFWAGESSADGVRALNRALRQTRAEYLWIACHAFESWDSLFWTLLEGMRLLPYVGAAIPAECSTNGSPRYRAALLSKEKLLTAEMRALVAFQTMNSEAMCLS